MHSQVPRHRPFQLTIQAALFVADTRAREHHANNLSANCAICLMRVPEPWAYRMSQLSIGHKRSFQCACTACQGNRGADQLSLVSVGSALSTDERDRHHDPSGL